MTKADLKTGMIVTVKNGTRYRVFRNVTTSFWDNVNVLVNVDDESWLSLGDFNDDLTVDGSEEFKIIKVEIPRCTTDLIWGKTCDRNKCTWEREEVKELTVKEIEKLLGYPIKIVEES